MADAELDAMASVLAALEPLAPPARERVLRWAATRMEISPAAAGQKIGLADGLENEDFREVGDLISAAEPTNGPERALVVGYWFQVIDGQDGWTGADVNATLKNMGSGLPNVTRTLDLLKARKPALVMQVGKSGRSRQARKTYKLTTAGIQSVRAMLSKVGADEP
jgi:hypothetical protein